MTRAAEKHVEDHGQVNPSTRKAYPDFGGVTSEKSRPTRSVGFSLPALVESSTWPPAYRLLLLEMLKKNQFGTELWLSQRKIAILLGVSYSTAQRMMDRLEQGHQFGKKRIVHCRPALHKLYGDNEHVNGKLRRSKTYALCGANFEPRPTIADLTPGAVCPLPLPERPIPPAPAKPAEHRSASRSKAEPPQQPKLTRRECALFVGQLVQVRKSHGVGFREALKIVCEGWQREPDAVIEALKFWRYKVEEPEGP